MKRIAAASIPSLVLATPAFAYVAQAGETDILTLLFVGFAALIIAFQLAPPLLLIYALVRGGLELGTPPAAPNGRREQLRGAMCPICQYR